MNKNVMNVAKGVAMAVATGVAVGYVSNKVKLTMHLVQWGR